MWSELILYLISIHIYAAEKTPNASYNCTIPPHPHNGVVIVANKSLEGYFIPGDDLPYFTVEFHCDFGYTHIGENYLKCAEDGKLSGNTQFECLPFCQSEEDDRVMSCGGAPRCFKTDVCPSVSPRVTFREGEPELKPDEGCGIISTRNKRQTLSYQSIDASTNSGDYGPYVSGGRSAFSGELPWHAGIYTKSKRPYMQICGGSLVSTNVVISAAHCFWSETQKQLPASNYAVAVGKLYRPWNEPHDTTAQKSNVSEIKIPPYFRGHATNLQDDIAILFLETSFKFSRSVRPICLDFTPGYDLAELVPGRFGLVGGWGLTSEDGPASPVLKVVQMPIVDLNDCFEHSDPTFRAHITSDKICAGFRNGTAVCKGDSGGGLAMVSEAHGARGRVRYNLRGIVSGAPQSVHLCNTLAWASFTHLITHEKFIKDTLAAGPTEKSV